MLKQRALLGSLFAALLSTAGSASAQVISDNGMEMLYGQAVQPIFDARCTGCHSGDNAPKLLRLDSWENVLAGGRHGEAVIPYNARNSLLVEYTTRANAPKHPLDVEATADTLTADEVGRIAAWIDAGALSDDGSAPFADSDEFVYACNEGAASVSVIDVKSGVVARFIDFEAMGFSDRAAPHHVAVEPDGSHWYVSLIGANKVLKFDRANNLVGQLDFERPGLLALDPNSDLLYVGRSMKAVNPPQRIGIIKRSTMEIEEVDVFIARPHAIALARDGAYVYTSSMSANHVVTMDTRTLEADLLTIPGPQHALVQFAVSPDGKTLVAGGHVSSKLLFFDLANPARPVLADSLAMKSMPWHPVYTRDGGLMYIPSKGANSVNVLNADHTLAAEISGRGLAQPHGSGISLDGSKLFITSNNLDGSYTPRYDLGDNAHVGTVSVIDTETYRILKVLEVEENTSGLGAR